VIRPVVDVVVDLVVGFSVETAEAVARTVEELRAAATLISRGEGANVETAETAARMAEEIRGAAAASSVGWWMSSFGHTVASEISVH